MKLLLSGPPASGKTTAVLTRFHAEPDSLLLVPSATMAEHLRHELARAAGSASGQQTSIPATVASRRIRTFGQFLDQWSAWHDPPDPLVHFLIQRALEHRPPPRFARVADQPGFLRALTGLFGQGIPERFPPDLAHLFSEVKRELEARGFAGRDVRLRDAAARVLASPATAEPTGPERRPASADSASLQSGSRVASGLKRAGDLLATLAQPARLPRLVLLDGFFSFARGELELLAALGDLCEVIVTLPDSDASAAARVALRSGGFVEQHLKQGRRSARLNLFSAPSMEREVEEIARRIVEHAAAGHPFREMGVVLRTRDPYGPLLETALARFGIPARAYFTDPLRSHPAVAYLSTLVESMLAGWDHELLLEALRIPVSGVGATPEGDRFDFALRARLPGKGLPLPAKLKLPGTGSKDKATVNTPPLLTQLTELTGGAAGDPPWNRSRLTSREWAGRLRRFMDLIPAPAITDWTGRAAAGNATKLAREQVIAWRSTATALQGFDDALESAAEALGADQRYELRDFWRHVETVLSLEPLRLRDLRRNVVHILDAYEARQWELAVVFVCGLTERHFPQYHREDPILGDAARRQAGLDTSADLQAAEPFLFELAASRATVETVLSYPRFDPSGEATLPSFFLEKLDGLDGRLPPEGAELCSMRVYPKPSRPPPLRPARHSAIHSGINDAALLMQIAERHQTLSATSIESFLQCPFQFFARKTLGLRERPPAPRDRLDLLLQGSILHRALAEWTQAPLLGVAVLDQVFRQECERARVPFTYRTEAVRLELLRHFTAFIEDRQIEANPVSTLVEQKFVFPLDDGLSITGRIDRIDVGQHNQALVIDYKYSAAGKIRERVLDSESGDLVQGGLYLLAAERALGLDPVGMLYCGLKKGVTWDGWHRTVAGLDGIGETRTAEALRELIEDAGRSAREVHAAILAGKAAVQPANAEKCRWCEFRDACRAESIEAESASTAGGTE